MSKINKLLELQHINATAYQRARQQLAVILAEENALRAELERIQGLASQARLVTQQNMTLATIGGDVLWQGWLGRSRTNLNMALARILAQKEHHLSSVKMAFGKSTVVDALLAEARKSESKKRNQKQMDTAINAAVLHQLRQ